MKTFKEIKNENILTPEISKKIETVSNAMKNPVLLFKGVDGKTTNGKKISAHNIPNVFFASYEFKKAKEYDRGSGVDILLIDSNKKESIKVEGHIVPSKLRKKEEELIIASNADFIELYTIDSRGKELQIVIKATEKVVKICNIK